MHYQMVACDGSIRAKIQISVPGFLCQQTSSQSVGLSTRPALVKVSGRVYRCRFAVELESLGVLCLLPAQATQVDNKEMLLYIHYTKRFALFQGEKYSNRNKLSLLAGFVLVEKIAGKETRQQHVARFEDHLFPLKNARILWCAVGKAQETGWSRPAIFSQTQK